MSRCYCNVSVDPNPLLGQDNLVRWWNGLENLEVVTNGGRSVTERGRPCTPQHRLRVVEGNNSFRIVAVHAINPCLRGRAHILLGPASVSDGATRIRSDVSVTTVIFMTRPPRLWLLSRRTLRSAAGASSASRRSAWTAQVGAKCHSRGRWGPRNWGVHRSRSSERSPARDDTDRVPRQSRAGRRVTGQR